MSTANQKDLAQHIGHEIECVAYGDQAKDGEYKGQYPNVAIECVTCSEVLLDYDWVSEFESIDWTAITSKDEARQYAIDWQNWSSEQSLSYFELAEWCAIFEKLAEKFNLTDEFKENGII